MGFDRYAAKKAAKNSMRQTSPHPVLVTLVYLLLTSVIVGAITTIAIGNPAAEMATYLLQGYELEEVLLYIYGRLAPVMGFYLIFSILATLYQMVMSFGYVSYGLRMARGEQPGFRNLFDGFFKFGRVLLMSVLTQVFVFLWMLVFLLPAIAVLAISVVLESDGLLVLYTLLCTAAMALSVVMSYRYRLAPYFVLDDPDCTARQSIARSKTAMRGSKGELFVLDLSFLGWAVLADLTAGILNIWVQPYRMATEANFYEYVVNGQNRQSQIPLPEL